MIQYLQQTKKDSVLASITKYKGGSWVYVENPSDDELAELVKKFKLDEGHLEDAIDPDEVPRVEREDELTYVFTRFPNIGDDLLLTTIPLLFIVGPKTLITISRMPMPQMAKIMASTTLDASQPVNAMLQLLDTIVDEYERRLNRISKQILTTRNRLRVQRISNNDFIAFVNIEDTLNEFMAAMLPTSTILKRLLVGRYIGLDEDNREFIEDLILSNEQSIEACKSNIKTIVSIREAYSTIATNNLNQIIRVLTSITVILTVPTIVTSAYGMNVDLPNADHPQAFGLVILVSVIISLMLLLFFRFKKWL